MDMNELSGCVRADAYNLILIFASYYYARERHVILKAALHSSCLVAASYIIAVLSSI